MDDNPGKANSYTRKNAAANRDREAARSAAWYAKNKQRSNAKCAERRAAKLRASLGGRFKAEVAAIYAQCPDGMQVDHHVPLKHPLVCGLHVPANLQYLTKSDNCRKRNSFRPQDFEV